MKKQVKRLLSVGLCLALGLSVGGGLAACNDDNGGNPTVDWNAGTWSKPDASYWLAGNLAGYDNTVLENDGWGADTGEETIPAERKFEQNSENEKLWRLVINLYKDEEFKIRFGSLGWDEESGKSKLSADSNLDKAVADDKNGIYDATGGMGGSNFKVAADGQYEVRIDATGAPSVVSYVRKGDAPKLPVKVSEVKLSSTTLTLTAGGDAATLTATVLPEDAVDKTVTWSSLKPSVATVDQNGVVTPVAKGTAIIVAAAGGVEAECAVTVVEEGTTIVDVTDVTLDKETATVKAGTPVKLTATVAPENATNKTVTWTSSDATVATVDKDGNVTAVKPGTATITATSGNKTDTCEVTVPDGFYLVGKFNTELGAKEWEDLTGKLNEISAKIVFVQDSENSDKYTLEAAFNRGDQIKILPMSGPGKNWENAIGLSYLVDENNKFSDGGGSNIKFLDSAKYRLTLEKVADNSEGAAEGAKKWQLSYEILEDIIDITYDTYKVEVWGTGNSWATAYEGKTVDAVTATEQWKTEITLTLAANEIFQFRQSYGTPANINYIGAGQGVNGSNASSELFANESSNYKCVTAGTYKFTLQFNEYGECESVTAVAVTE